MTPFSQNAVNQIAISDFRLLQLNSAPAGYSIYTGSYDRFRLLEGTVSLALNNVQFTFGKQSLWLGPSDTGALLFSNNAEPITMLRIVSFLNSGSPSGLGKQSAPRTSTSCALFRVSAERTISI